MLCPCTSNLRPAGRHEDFPDSPGLLLSFNVEYHCVLLHVITCDFSPSAARYTRVCTELGFHGLNKVMTLIRGYIDLTLAVEPIGFHNAMCSDRDDFIHDCIENPKFKKCTHTEDVYIVCNGNATKPPAELRK